MNASNPAPAKPQMKPPEIVTLTGVDERTDLGQLYRLVHGTPGVTIEIGVLFSAAPAGRPRYPSTTWIAELTRTLGRHVAIHVCGRQARAELLDYKHLVMTGPCGRIQVNGLLRADTVLEILNAYRKQVIITQHNDSNPHLASQIHDPRGMHQVLVDASGGTGAVPEAWDRPICPPEKHVGFAGGLGPHVIKGELPRIAAAARGTPYWIDMESRLRNEHDWFDIERAKAVVAEVQSFTAYLQALQQPRG